MKQADMNTDKKEYVKRFKNYMVHGGKTLAEKIKTIL